MRRLRWDTRSGPLPKRPYLDTALVYLGLAVVIVVVATASGGGFARALVIAALFWIVATGYGFLTMRRRIARARREEVES